MVELHNGGMFYSVECLVVWNKSLTKMVLLGEVGLEGEVF